MSPVLKPSADSPRRGHTWTEVPSEPDRRICARCAAPGRVNNQGVVIACCTEVSHEAIKRDLAAWCALEFGGIQSAFDPNDPDRTLDGKEKS
jgi:hypothetical protein